MVAPDVAARARAIRLLVSDIDGVLTDAGVYYSARGEELLRFSRRDGLGVELAARAGIRTALLSRADSEIVRARAKTLSIEHVFLGVRDKGAFLSQIERDTGVSRSEIAYIGDDVIDLEIMGLVAVAGAPVDAVPEVRAAAHFVAASGGGAGAFREFSDWILQQRIEWEVTA